MTAYVRVSTDELPPGHLALLLFVADDELCAGVIERHPDGRLERRVPDAPAPHDLVLVICRLMAQAPPDADLFVVLEPGAFWPEAFPELRRLDASG